MMRAATLVASLFAPAAAAAAGVTTFLDFYSSRNCSGSPNSTVALSEHNETLCRCAWLTTAAAAPRTARAHRHSTASSVSCHRCEC